MKKSLLSLLCTSVLLSASEETNLLNLSLEELLEVEIKGSTLTDEKLMNVPSSFSVFTRSQIETMGLNTLDELMNYVPGFQSYQTDSSNVGSKVFSVRGRRIGTSAAEVLVLVDGLRMNDPRTGGMAEIMPQIPLDWIERVEFIRGGSSAIYGSNAMMGVINIVTVKDKNEVNMGYGSYDRVKGELFGSIKNSGIDADIFLNYNTNTGQSYEVPDSFAIGQTTTTTDPSTVSDVALKIKVGESTFNYIRSHAKGDDFYVLGNVANGINDSTVTNETLSLAYTFNPLLNLTSTIRAQYLHSTTDLSMQLLPAGALSALSTPSSSSALLGETTLSSKEWRGYWENSYVFDSSQSFQFGAEYRNIKINDLYADSNFDLEALASGNFPIQSAPSNSIETLVESSSNRDIIGIFGQYQSRLTNDVLLTLGMRYDDHEDVGSNVSPKASLIYYLNEENVLKGIYSSAYRAPSDNEMFLKNNPALNGNPNLEAESVQSYDLIWMGNYESIAWEIGYFENHFDNSIVQVSNNVGGRKFENVDQGPTKGFEFELNYQPANEWMLRGTYTYFTELPELSYREANSLASFIINFSHNKINLNLSGTYVGARQTPLGDDTTLLTLDSYWLVNAKANYKIMRDLDIYIQGANLFDEVYNTPAQSYGNNDGTVNRGIEFMAGFRYRF